LKPEFGADSFRKPFIELQHKFIAAGRVERFHEHDRFVESVITNRLFILSFETEEITAERVAINASSKRKT
jgi:hypothetical protein